MTVASPPSEGLIHHYTLDELTGPVEDTAGGASKWDGDNFGATRGIAGPVGAGYEFDGTGVYVSVNPVIRGDHEEYTLSVWAKGFNSLLSVKTPQSESYLNFVPNDAPYVPQRNHVYYGMGLNDGDDMDLDASHLGDLSEDFHLYTLRGKRTGPASHRVDIFIDGQLLGGKDKARTIPAWNYMELGRNVIEHNGQFNGVLDDLRLWDRALTDLEIAEDYGGSPPTGSGPVHHYTLDESMGSVADSGSTASLLPGQNFGTATGVAGPVGTGYEFDGSGGYVTIKPVLRGEHDEYTFSVWARGFNTLVSFKTPQYENYLNVVPSDAPYAPQRGHVFYHLGMDNGDRHLDLDATHLGDLTQGFHLYTVRGTRTGPASHRVDIFVDGQLLGGKERDTTIPAWDYAELGRNVVEHNGQLNGVLDDLRIWSRALTDAEIAASFNESPHADPGDDRTIESTSPAGALVDLDATASFDPDGDGLTFEWSVPEGSGVVLDAPTSPVPSGVFPIGTTVVTLTVTDSRGATSTQTFTVTVQDASPPVVEGTPADLVVEATSAAGAPVTWDSPTASDAVDGIVSVACEPASGTSFPIGATTVTCTAGDSHGNLASTAFSITVVDTTPPHIIAVPANLAIEATSVMGASASWAAPTSTDLVDGGVTVACTPPSGSTFSVGTTTVTCTATDAHGNAAYATFTVTVQDSTAPAISGVPSALTVEATSAAGAAVTWTAPTATDLADGVVAVACTPASGATFAMGTTSVTCTATDAHGNSATTTFAVTVHDTTAPVIDDKADVSAKATSTSGAAVSFAAPTATDVVSGMITVVCTPASGTLFEVGVTAVHCTATDSHGNAATSEFDVIVTIDPTYLTGQVAEQLNSLIPSSDKKTVKELLKAITAIQDSLTPSYWADDTHLSDAGRKVYQHDSSAVAALLDIESPNTIVLQAIESLVACDEVLAATALADAKAANPTSSYLGTAEAEMASGAASTAAGAPRDAILHYRKAWKAAMQALGLL